MPKQISLYQPLKLFIADVHLPKTSWKVLYYHSLGLTSVPNMAVTNTCLFLLPIS